MHKLSAQLWVASTAVWLDWGASNRAVLCCAMLCCCAVLRCGLASAPAAHEDGAHGRFLAATCALREENELYLLEYDDLQQSLSCAGKPRRFLPS